MRQIPLYAALYPINGSHFRNVRQFFHSRHDSGNIAHDYSKIPALRGGRNYFQLS
jgi:hypothetical protein